MTVSFASLISYIHNAYVILPLKRRRKKKKESETGDNPCLMTHAHVAVPLSVRACVMIGFMFHAQKKKTLDSSLLGF